MRLPNWYCFFFGHSEPDSGNIGIDLRRPDWVEFFCTRCERLISKQPLAEVSDKTLSTVDYLLDDSEDENEEWK